MVLYVVDEKKRWLRPGRFCICKLHTKLKKSVGWSAVEKYISEHPELLEHSISIDVDLLPLNLRSIISELSQLDIIDPRQCLGK
jgi:hypothetical protein